MLRASGTAYVKVNYFTTPFSEAGLRELVRKMDIPPRDLLRKSEAIYRQLNLGKRDLSDDELIRLMVAYPELIQRPIVEYGERAVLGRPTENIRQLLTQGAEVNS